MGHLRFRVPSIDRYDPLIWQTAYLTGMEGIPWACQSRITGDQFIISRAIDESGRLHIVWPSKSLGNVVLATTSLRLSDQPYELLLELARGAISRLRNQTFEWQKIGLRFTREFLDLSEAALGDFISAVTCRDNSTARDELCQSAIDRALECAALLASLFSTQSLESRVQAEGKFSTLIGTCVAPQLPLEKVAESIKSSFNLLAIGVDLAAVESASGKRNFAPFDHQVEWARENGLKICCGPLVNFRVGAMPKWMVLLNEGFNSVLNAACRHVQETVDRYRGMVHVWNCVTALNVPGELRWSDEQTLRFAVSLIETVRQADPRCPVLISLDQPWSEYLRDREDGISPIHFADALIRADLGLSGLALELNLNTWPDGSLPRDPLEIGSLIDRWGQLGLPLMVVLTYPSRTDPDPQAVNQRQPVNCWRSPHSIGSLSLQPEQIIRLLLAKQNVHAIVWNQASDQVSHPFPHSGLWDEAGQPKPLLHQFTKMRQQLLQ